VLGTFSASTRTSCQLRHGSFDGCRCGFSRCHDAFLDAINRNGLGPLAFATVLPCPLLPFIDSEVPRCRFSIPIHRFDVEGEIDRIKESQLESQGVFFSDLPVGLRPAQAPPAFFHVLLGHT
jgi:hypothetical protein